MGFKAYRITPLGDAEWLLEDPRPLRFAGPHGLVARWCRERYHEIGSRLWIVEDSAWLRLESGEATADAWIVFEQQDDNGRRFARLERVSGSFGCETRLGLNFSPLTEVATSGDGLRVRVPAKACSWSEELGLDGGPGSDDCSWAWQAPKLAMSSATAGPAR